MKRLGVWLIWMAGALWALVAFLASNSPTDVQQRADGWLELPIIRELPDKLVAFAGNPVVFAVTFFSLGVLAGWRLTKWWSGRDTLPWWQNFGEELSLLAYQIEQSRWTTDLTGLNADIDVIRVKAAKHRFPFPKFSDGFNTVQSLLPYLVHVSAHLKAGHVDHARTAAEKLSRPAQ